MLALTANDRTAATEQIMRSDFKVSFCKERTNCKVCSSLFLSATLQSPGKSGDRILTLDNRLSASLTCYVPSGTYWVVHP